MLPTVPLAMEYEAVCRRSEHREESGLPSKPREGDEMQAPGRRRYGLKRPGYAMGLSTRPMPMPPGLVVWNG